MNNTPESTPTGDVANRETHARPGRLDQLLSAAPPPAEFVSLFLAALCSDFQLSAAAIWKRQGASFLLLQEQGLRSTGWLDLPVVKPIQARLLALAEQESKSVTARTSDWPELQSLPLFQVVIVPFAPANREKLLLQVQISRLLTNDELQALQRQLVTACQRTAPVLNQLSAPAFQPDHVHGRQPLFSSREKPLPAGSPPGQDLMGLLELTKALQQDLSVRYVSQTAVNDGRHWLKCDRLSLWSRCGRILRPTAVSGQAVVHKSSPAILRLRALAERLIRAGKSFVYPEVQTELPEELGRLLADYVAETNSRQIVIIPLFRPERPVSEEHQRSEQPRRKPTPRPYGCLIAEQLGEHDPLPELQASGQSLAECVAPALWGARRFEGVFLQPLWRQLGDLRDWILDGRLGRTTALLLFVAVVLAVGIFLPWEYRVEATGRLMPADRSDLFAPQDAEVEQVLVKSGQRVAVDQPLVRLRNRELEQQIAATRKELDEQRQSLRALQSQLDGAIRRADRDAEIRLQGQLLGTQVLAQGLENELSILEARSGNLLMTSPVAGTVATFQIDQILRRRPVHRGELLVSVMNEQGSWQLELDVPDSKLGHVLHATQQTPDPLRLEFLLVTQPEQTYRGTVRDIATATATDGQDGVVVPVLADFSPDQSVEHRIGAEVRARIHCGPQPLGYAIFGDVLDFVQRRAWWW